jgi:RNA polymerase primary sigma factor/RNA polymerase sigma factor
MRAERIYELPLAYMPSPEFDQPDAEQQILSSMPQSDQALRKARPPAGVPPYLASLYAIPLLTREQEAHLFRKYNYLKYLASTLREQLHPTRPEARLMAEIERLYDEAVATKNQLIQANLRLVVSIAKRYASDADPLPDLISDGNLSLFRAVEKFDYTLGYKFSTYATWALKNNFIRGLASEHAQRERIHSTTEEVFTTQPDLRTNPTVEEKLQTEREALVGRILDRLDSRERQIITSHFGLNRSEEPRSRRAVGTALGISKERVRQLEIRALTKLQAAVLEHQLEDVAA